MSKKITMIVLTIILLFGIVNVPTEAEQIQVVEVGKYEFEIPASWKVESNEDASHCCESSNAPIDGGYVLFLFDSQNMGSWDLNTIDNSIDAYLEDIWAKEGFADKISISHVALNVDVLGCRCVRGLYKNLSTCVCIWADSEGFYKFIYMNGTVSSDVCQEEFQALLSTVKKAKTERKAETETEPETEIAIDSKTEPVIEQTDVYVNIDTEYEEYARNPTSHADEAIEFTGKVVQVVEGAITTYRIAIGGDSSSIFLVKYLRQEYESRILKDDFVTVRGRFTGATTYQSTLGGNITVPSCIAEKIEQMQSLDITVTGNQSGSDSDQFPAVGYTYNTSSTNSLYLVLSNKSGRTVKVDATIKFYGENGELIGVANKAEHAFSNDSELLVKASNDIPFTAYEYSISIQDETRYASVTEYLQEEITYAGQKVIIGITNTGTIPAKFVEYDVLFMLNGNIVSSVCGYAVDSDWEIKPEKTKYFELKVSTEFDDVLIFLKGYGDN